MIDRRLAGAAILACGAVAFVVVSNLGIRDRLVPVREGSNSTIAPDDSGHVALPEVPTDPTTSTPTATTALVGAGTPVGSRFRKQKLVGLAPRGDDTPPTRPATTGRGNGVRPVEPLPATGPERDDPSLLPAPPTGPGPGASAPVVPEAPFAVALPLSAVAVVGGYGVVRSRRRRRSHLDGERAGHGPPDDSPMV